MEYCNQIYQVKHDIFKYFSVSESSIGPMKYVNKDWYSFLQDTTQKMKIDSLLYVDFISNFSNPEIRIGNMDFIFFNMKFMQTLFKDFKKYLFYISDSCKNQHREFLLLSRLNKMHYVKRLSDNIILMVYVDSSENTYYSFFEKKINFTEFPLPTHGYLNYRGKVNKENYASILELVN